MHNTVVKENFYGIFWLIYENVKFPFCYDQQSEQPAFTKWKPVVTDRKSTNVPKGKAN